MDSMQMICPWCDTEIVWDPEVGPEEECPHCLNELGNYRSMKLSIEKKDISFDDDTEEEVDLEYTLQHDLEDDLIDDGLESVQSVEERMISACLDMQFEAPECFSCRELMLHVGEQLDKNSSYLPVIPEALGAPLLKKSPKVDIYVCPTCYRVDYFLNEESRTELSQALKKTT